MRDCSENSLVYAYDPRGRRQRARWRVYVALVGGVGPALRLLAIPCCLILAARSAGNFLAMLGSVNRPSTADGVGGRWDNLAASGVLWVMAFVFGVMLISAVAAIVRDCLGEPPGSVALDGGGEAEAIVRQARQASVAARASLGRLRSADMRGRLRPHVDALDTTTWTMANVMAKGAEDELARRCRWVTETAAELEAVVEAEEALRALVPTAPPVPPPDPATVLEGIDPLLTVAHDEVRGLHLGIEAMTGEAVSPSFYDPVEPAPREVRER